MLAEIDARYAPHDAIRHVFLSFTTDLSENGGNRGCFLTNTALELAAHDAEIRAIVASAQEGVTAAIAIHPVSNNCVARHRPVP